MVGRKANSEGTMRTSVRWLVVAVALAAPACRETLYVDDGGGGGGGLLPPANFTYQVEPSGDPDRPAGILLSWDDDGDPNLAEFRIYSRGSSTGAFGLRGATTSNTFHDNGVPHLEYYAVAVDLGGFESNPSAVIRVDERLALETPFALTSISLDGAVHLQWTDNAYSGDPARFSHYRVYSTAYDLDANLCDVGWGLEGTTVAPEFLAAAMPNGVPRCFGVSAISREGYESLWAPLRQDTPRPDARNTLVFADQEDATKSGFRFWNDADGDGRGEPGELGLVQAGSRTDIDFRVSRDAADSTLWLVPVYSGTRLRLYDTAPLADLTDIDLAPVSGYTRDTLEAVPTYGYVFQIDDVGARRYGALRVTHVSRDYIIFDWSLQTDPGNPELVIRGNLPTSLETGMEIPGAK